MRASHSLSTMTALLIVLAAVGLGLPGLVGAQMRDFSGKVVSVSGSKLVVDSAGDKITFVPAADVRVSGHRASFGELQKNDRVTVSWKLADTPRKAYRIVVRAARKND